MQKIIEDLTWRYATKKFDPTRKISDTEFDVVKSSLHLVPTSYGLQPFKFLLIESKEVREQLMKASYGQQQVIDASHLIVLCSYRELTEEHIHNYMDNIAATRNIESNTLTGFRDLIKNTSLQLSPDKQLEWMSKQVYIALGQLLHTCASLRIDATPMEGFNADEYDKILGLSEKNLHATLVCPIGYRHPEDPTQHKKKVRKSKDDLFEII